jgi:hypothetical protein
MQTTGTYTDPTTPAEADTIHDLTRAVDGSDALVTFRNIELTGDFYNSTRGGLVPAASVPAGTGGGTTTTVGAGATTTIAPTTTVPPTTTAAPPAGGATTTTLPQMVSISKNLALTFDNAKIAGVITASTAVHVPPPTPSGAVTTTTTAPATGSTTTTMAATTTTAAPTTTTAGSGTTTTTLPPAVTITAADYRSLGEVINTPAEAVNNGVVVVLMNASVWTVTGTSYITSLTIGEGCSVTVRDGQKLTVKIDGRKVKKLAAGSTYKGKIELIVEGTPLPTTTTIRPTTTTS